LLSTSCNEFEDVAQAPRQHISAAGAFVDQLVRRTHTSDRKSLLHLVSVFSVRATKTVGANATTAIVATIAGRTSAIMTSRFDQGSLAAKRPNISSLRENLC
jgi:hypothetical protein